MDPSSSLPPPSSPPSRRRFLQVGLLGGALLAVAGLAGQSTRGRGPAGPLQVFSDEEYRIVAAIAERLCPGGKGPGGEALPSASQIGLTEKLDAFMARSDPWSQTDLKRLLVLFESAWGGLLLEGRVTPFTALSPEEQDETLESWRTSGLDIKRTGYSVIRALLVTRYWADPRVYPATGYRGAPAAWRGTP